MVDALVRTDMFAQAHPDLAEMADRLGLSFDPGLLQMAAKLGRKMATQPAPSSPGVTPAPAGNRAALEAEAERLAADPERWSKKINSRLKEIDRLLSPGTFNRYEGGLEGRR